MKIRYLTLLTALIFLGFTVSAYAIKPVNNYPKYDVWIDGGWVAAPHSETNIFLPGKGLGWTWNGTQVGSTYADGREFQLNMTYILETVSAGCFLSTVKMGGFFRKKKPSKAEGMFWFHGTTSNPNENVLYQLKIEGHFGMFPDNEGRGFPGNGKIMYMTHWTLTVANQGKKVLRRSCVGSGIFGSGTGNDHVTVTFTPVS